MPKEIITGNGKAKVVFNETDFKTANKLKSTLTKAVKAQGYNLADLGTTETLEVLDVSEELQSVLFECLKRCTYNSAKITEDTFEPLEARSDYYEILLVCLEVNYFPFVKAPSSLSEEKLTEKR